MEDKFEQKEDFQEENRLIVQKIEKIITNTEKTGNILESWKEVWLYGREGSKKSIFLQVAYDESDLTLLLGFSPKEFSYPRYVFDVFDYDLRNSRFTTPYGILPGYVIGADNHLYTLANYYFFGGEGKAVKLERVDDEGDKSANFRFLQDLKEEGVEVSTVEFTPSRDDSRYTQLSAEDYELIESVLQQIEAGEFIPKQG